MFLVDGTTGAEEPKVALGVLMMLVCFLHATRWMTFCDAYGPSVCMCVCEQQDNSLRMDKTWDMGNIDPLETHIPNLVDLGQTVWA